MTVCMPPGSGADTAPLRVYPPRESLPAGESIPKTPRAVADLDAAFQLATGWRLAWHPPRARQPGDRRTRHDWLRIEDLSEVLPPGIPAVSRIYCENLVMRLNRLFDSWLLGHSGEGAGFQHPATVGDWPGNRLACHLDSFSIEPLRVPGMDAAAAPCGCEWAMTPDGRIAGAMFAANGPSDLAGAGLMAARSAFVTAARAGADCDALANHVHENMAQLFCGDLEMDAVIWTLDPLTGAGQVVGSSGFELRLGREPLAYESSRAREFSWYRRQVLIAARFPVELAAIAGEDQDRWLAEVSLLLARNEPRSWTLVLKQYVEHAIPALQTHPDVALAMVRHP